MIVEPTHFYTGNFSLYMIDVMKHFIQGEKQH